MATLEIVRLLVLLAVMVFPAVLTCRRNVACKWANNWDAPLEYECPSVHQSVSYVQSYHNNHREDRRYRFCCRRIPKYVKHCSSRCYWTGYMNNWDAMLMFNCGKNGYINGFRSVHHNHYEDRRWKVRCCTVKGLHLYDCDYTGWTNTWDRPQKYNVPSGKILNGALSIHNNHVEDRRWRFRICKARRARDTDETDEEFDKFGDTETVEKFYDDVPATEVLTGNSNRADLLAIEASSEDTSYSDRPESEMARDTKEEN